MADGRVVDSPPVVGIDGATPALDVIADRPADVVVSSVSVGAWMQAVRRTHSAIAESRISNS